MGHVKQCFVIIIWLLYFPIIQSWDVWMVCSLMWDMCWNRGEVLSSCCSLLHTTLSKHFFPQISCKIRKLIMYRLIIPSIFNYNVWIQSQSDLVILGSYSERRATLVLLFCVIEISMSPIFGDLSSFISWHTSNVISLILNLVSL